MDVGRWRRQHPRKRSDDHVQRDAPTCCRIRLPSYERRGCGLDRSDEGSHEKLLEIYQSFAEKSERTDAPRRIPLDFLKGTYFVNLK